MRFVYIFSEDIHDTFDTNTRTSERSVCSRVVIKQNNINIERSERAVVNFTVNTWRAIRSIVAPS